jgi:hypothetical protein
MLDRRIAVLATLAAASVAMADESNPRREAYVRSIGSLDALVDRAKDGQIGQDRLRRERRRVEARLEHELSVLPVEVKPGDLREESVARTEMNQSVIRSQEVEFFGLEDRPEWGWFPSRQVTSTGSALTVSKDGRADYNALR